MFTGLSTFLLLAAVSHAALNGNDLLFGVLLGICALAAFGWAAVTRAGAGPLVAAVACVVILVLGYLTGAPLYVRWKLSKPAFSAWVAQGHDQSDIEKPSRIGLFRIRKVEESSDGFLFYDSLWDMSDIGDGIAYLPHETATAFPESSQCTFKHLEGPWYSWIGYS